MLVLRILHNSDYLIMSKSNLNQVRILGFVPLVEFNRSFESAILINNWKSTEAENMLKFV